MRQPRKRLLILSKKLDGLELPELAVIFRTTNGLAVVPPYKRANMPLYLTDTHEVLVAPTLWGCAVALRRSRSTDTLKQYAASLARFLSWLDHNGYSAVNWQNVDRDIVQHYITDLMMGRDEQGRPSDQTIESYVARVADFYKWAQDNGYHHYWDMKRDVVEYALGDQSLLSRTIEQEAREEKIAAAPTTGIKRELDKFLDRNSFEKAIKLFDDYVYAVIAIVIWMTALRPKDLLQLPYKGTGNNESLRRYRSDELENVGDLPFTFASKGKRRAIRVPALLWSYVCKSWMPHRQERALLYAKEYGVNPPNNVLFLSAAGRPVTYKMIHSHFARVAEHRDFGRKTLTPMMLRHSFATYFVIKALEAREMIGKPYVYDAVVDEALREYMGHADIGITYKHYVHLVNRFVRDDLISTLRQDEFQALLQSSS